jgi:hypothetical protein
VPASLDGKSVIVTGGSKGIGRVFAGCGAKVLIVPHLRRSSQGRIIIMTEGLQGMGEEYLATREAGYITGQTIVVDGGQVLSESLEALTSA